MLKKTAFSVMSEFSSQLRRVLFLIYKNTDGKNLYSLKQRKYGAQSRRIYSKSIEVENRELRQTNFNQHLDNVNYLCYNRLTNWLIEVLT